MTENEGVLIENFITLIDRYLEVSNLYHHRMTLDAETILDINRENRLNKLVSVIQSAELDSNSKPLKKLLDGSEMSQSVAPTEEVFYATGLYQKIVLGRIDRIKVSPNNVMKLKNRLRLAPIDFLGSFKSVSYAWDILTELASLSVLPEPEELVARDFIYMHCVELRLHLNNIIEFYNSQTDIDLADEEIVLAHKPLNYLEPTELIDIIDHLIRDVPLEIREAIDSLRNQVLDKLLQEREYVQDSLLGFRLDKAINICNDLVIYGLAVGYSLWYRIAIKSQSARGLLRKNSLFATRILLDERRWEICRSVSKMAYEMAKAINNLNQRDELEGTHMLRANWYFSRKKCQEDIIEDVRAWETESIHKRYKFLQLILEDEYENAAECAKSLLEVENETGRPNLTLEEIREWPVLEEFRKTDFCKEILE